MPCARFVRAGAADARRAMMRRVCYAIPPMMPAAHTMRLQQMRARGFICATASRGVDDESFEITINDAPLFDVLCRFTSRTYATIIMLHDASADVDS